MNQTEDEILRNSLRKSAKLVATPSGEVVAALRAALEQMHAAYPTNGASCNAAQANASNAARKALAL